MTSSQGFQLLEEQKENNRLNHHSRTTELQNMLTLFKEACLSSYKLTIQISKNILTTCLYEAYLHILQVFIKNKEGFSSQKIEKGKNRHVAL